MPNERASITLRPYQKEVCTKVLSHIENDKPKKVLIHMATGAGKSVVLAHLVMQLWKQQRVNTKNPAVILSISWDIVRQLYAILLRIGFSESQIGLIGGENKGLGIPQGTTEHSILLSTLNTFSTRIQRQRRIPSFVFHDEAHYGDKNTMCNILCRWLKNKPTVHVGCTATPKVQDLSNFPSPICSVSFSKLVELGYLASPNFVRINTEEDWHPVVSREHFDFDNRSLEELNSPTRNRCIAEHYRKNSTKYGTTLVFAINTDHAEKLGEVFAKHGIACGVIHGRRTAKENQEQKHRFQQGEIDVLISIRMMTTGIDIPKIKTLFLCRPTTSAILYMQMVGRGARLYPNQKSFYVVDFVDNLHTHAHRLQRGESSFTGSRPQPNRSYRTEPEEYTEHFFDPKKSPIRLPVCEEIPKDVQLLWFHEGQSFGVEFEISHRDFNDSNAWKRSTWKPIAERIRKKLVAELGEHRVAKTIHDYNRGSHSVWNVEYDRSVGWEVKTPILCGVAGALELVKACTVLNQCCEDEGLVLNANTSVHVHLGWDAKLSKIKELLHVQAIMEPAFANLVAPSRILHFGGVHYKKNTPNFYCKPVSFYVSGKILDEISSFDKLCRTVERYCTLNITNLRELGTVEFRMHSGSLNASKILLWISIKQQLLHMVSKEGFSLPAHKKTWKKRKTIVPNNQLLSLAKEFLIDGTHDGLRVQLEKRQQQIRRRWQREDVLQEWLT